jgi:hypothetical protein
LVVGVRVIWLGVKVCTMREVSAKWVGSCVLVAGATVALAAGMLVPWLGGAGWGSAGPSAARPTSLAQAVEADATNKLDPASAGVRLTARGGGDGRGGGPAGAGGSEGRVRGLRLEGAVAAAARMPAGADMVMVVEHAADWRNSPFGEAAVRFLIDASDATPTRQAWTTLASQLGWSEPETFDRLLGRRVVLLARGFDNAETTRWALLSDVSLETDERLKARLQAAQRTIDKGHQILSVEKGKYELTSHRRAGAGSGGDEVTIVLGPSGRSELFDEAVGVLSRGADEPLGEREVIAVASAAGAPEILLLARLGLSRPIPPGEDRWSDFFMLSGGRAIEARGVRSGDRFGARVVYCERDRREGNMTISPTSDAVFQAMSPGSLLTIVQAAPVRQILGDSFRMLDALRELPLPWTAQALVGSRQVFSVRPMPVSAIDEADRSPLSVVMAVETVSPAEIAPILDGSITRFIAAQEQMLGATRPPPRDFAGVMPGVTRVLPLDLPPNHPVRLFVTDPLTLSWSYPSTRQERTTIDGQTLATGGGWWVMSLAPEPPGMESLPEVAHNQAAACLSAAEVGGRRVPGDERRWVWQASARPAELERRLPGALLLPDVGGFRSAMRRLADVKVELQINRSGDIQGDLNATLAPVPSQVPELPDPESSPRG